MGEKKKTEKKKSIYIFPFISVYSKSAEDLQQQVEELVGELQSKVSVYH